MSLSIEGPSKADIECHDNEDGTCRVTYKPTEPGTYIINIKFADEHVPGMLPLTLKAPRKFASENVVCLCRLLHLLANFSNLHFPYRQTDGPRSDSV